MTFLLHPTALSIYYYYYSIVCMWPHWQELDLSHSVAFPSKFWASAGESTSHPGSFANIIFRCLWCRRLGSTRPQNTDSNPQCFSRPTTEGRKYWNTDPGALIQCPALSVVQWRKDCQVEWEGSCFILLGSQRISITVERHLHPIPVLPLMSEWAYWLMVLSEPQSQPLKDIFYL